MITRLIFVCTENTCQSPIAETIFKSIDHDLDIEVYSRGLVVLFSEPINPKSETVLATHGMLPDNHMSHQFQPDEVNEETLILTMNTVQKRRLATDFLINENTYTIREFAGDHGDITDPYGRDTDAYETCYSELFSLMKKIIHRLMYGELPPEDETDETDTAS